MSGSREKGQKGQKQEDSWGNRAQNKRIPIYLDVGSSDFDETFSFRKNSACEKDEG